MTKTIDVSAELTVSWDDRSQTSTVTVSAQAPHVRAVVAATIERNIAITRKRCSDLVEALLAVENAKELKFLGGS